MAKGKLKCSKCDRTFSMAAHLARHVSTTHASRQKKAAAKRKRAKRRVMKKVGRPRTRKVGRPKKRRTKKLGRPKVKTNADQLLSLCQAGLSSRQIAKQLDLSPSTVLRRLKAASKTC